jgi:hypothetical protein
MSRLPGDDSKEFQQDSSVDSGSLLGCTTQRNVAHLTNDENLSKMKAIGSPPKTDEPPLSRGSFEARIYGYL